MRAKVAVATVSGKAYFLLTKELREKNIEFISIVPGEPIPVEVKVVITTQREKVLVNNYRTLVYNPDTDPSTVINEAKRILQGKETYDKIVVGIDPGEVCGLVVISDGKVTETKVCCNVAEVLNEIRILMNDIGFRSTAVSVRVGNGVPIHRDLLEILDSELPGSAVLEVVSEAGTNRPSVAHRRGLRDIASAIQIAGRVGHVYPRRNVDELNI